MLNAVVSFGAINGNKEKERTRQSDLINTQC